LSFSTLKIGKNSHFDPYFSEVLKPPTRKHERLLHYDCPQKTCFFASGNTAIESAASDKDVATLRQMQAKNKQAGLEMTHLDVRGLALNMFLGL